MVDYDPKAINPKELGLSVPEVNPSTQRFSTPIVLRDQRGRLRWRLPGNTPEEDELLGIQNVQGLFLEKFPEFDELFPRGEDGKIDRDKTEEAATFIQDKIGWPGSFFEVYNDRPCRGKELSYFEGKYSIVISKSFSRWGLVFATMDVSFMPHDSKGNISWSELKNNPLDKFYFIIEQEAQRLIGKGIILTTNGLKSSGLHNFLGGVQRYYLGALAGLQLNLGINSRKPDGYWTPEQTEQEAREFVSEHGDMSYGLLSDFGKYGLFRAASLYRGGINGLRKKIGVSSIQKPHGYWTPEQTEQEAREFVSEHGDMSYTLMREYDRDDLTFGVHKYPGGINALRLKFGLPIVKRANNYYTKKTIERDAQEVYTKYGSITHELLRKLGRSGLASAISSDYPGGMDQLKNVLGIPQQENKSDGYWTPEQIEREASVFLQIDGRLSTYSLKKRSRGDLASAIDKKYPGGMKVLKEKLGIITEAKEISPEEADNYLRNLLYGEK